MGERGGNTLVGTTWDVLIGRGEHRNTLVQRTVITYIHLQLGAEKLYPKHVRLVVDVSASMYRFNEHDGRLDRSLEAVLMVMEAFDKHQKTFRVSVGVMQVCTYCKYRTFPIYIII